MRELVSHGRPTGAPESAMRAGLRAAIAAPSIHNSQPWLFRQDGLAVEVYVDDRRRLPVLDPLGRAMHLSVGAAILNMRVAILARGRTAQVRLLPEPDRPDLAAILSVGPPAPVGPTDRALARAVSLRRSNRSPFRPIPVPESVLTALVGAALVESATLIVPDAISRWDVLQMVRAAGLSQQSDPRYVAELAYWTARLNRRTDGVPEAAFGPRSEPSTVPLRDFGLVQASNRRGVRFEADPTIAVLYSHADKPVDWLIAGQALQRVLLTATTHGVSTTLLTQPVEVPALRRQLAAPSEPHVAQAVLRLGYGRRAPAAPRRPLTEMLLTDRPQPSPGGSAP